MLADVSRRLYKWTLMCLNLDHSIFISREQKNLQQKDSRQRYKTIFALWPLNRASTITAINTNYAVIKARKDFYPHFMLHAIQRGLLFFLD